MLHSNDYRELRNGKRYQVSDEREMGHHSSIEGITNRISSEEVEGENPAVQTLTQQAVKEQIRGLIAPLTRQLDDLTRLVEGKSTSRLPNSYPRTELGTASGEEQPQSDMVTGVHRNRHRRPSSTKPDTDDEMTYPDYDLRRHWK